MKVEGWLFLGCGTFFGGTDVVYWYTSHDPTGTTALALAVGLLVLTGFCVLFTGAQQPPPGQRGDPADGGQQPIGILAAGPGCPLAAPLAGIAQALETGPPGGLFFTGNFLFQVPAASFAGRRSDKALISWSLPEWGVFADAQGVIGWYPLLLTDRFPPGVAAVTVVPAMLVFLTHWFSDSRRGRAATLVIPGNPVTLLWMPVISGYLIAVTCWRWMFTIEGGRRWA